MDNCEKINQIEIYARENHIPVLLPDSANFLKKLVQNKQPKKILEIGTAIGYSGSIMLLACQNATLVTLEKDKTCIQIAKQNFENVGVAERVKIICGDATDNLKKLNEKFDFVFLDGPKSKYLEQFEIIKKLITNGGTLVADNVLYHGMTYGKDYPDHKHRTIILKLREFIKTITENHGAKLFDIGDGLIVIEKFIEA